MTAVAESVRPGPPSARAANGLAIETSGLTKRFNGRAVVDGLDLAVPQGSVFGFLGPNGSGKTTTIRMLLGLAYPSAGRARLLGGEMPGAAADVLPAVGSMVEGPAFYPYLSGRANLERFDAVGPGGSPRDREKRVAEALARVGLSGAAGKKFKAYSQGMGQRLALARTLLRPVELLVLDEPTNGLDPQGTREVRNLIRRLASDGITIFLSSHLLSEIEQVCTHAAVLFAGRTVAQGTMSELRSAQRPVLKVETPDVDAAVATLRSVEGIGLVSSEDTTTVRAELLGAAPEEVNASLVHADVRVRALVPEQPSLEDLFVSLTGEGFDVAQ